MTENAVAERPVRPQLQLTIDSNKAGEIEAVATASWELPETLIRELEQSQLHHPAVAVVVARPLPDSSHAKHPYYRVSKIYVIEDLLVRREKLMFRSTDNIVFAGIFDLTEQNRETITRWKSRPHDFHLFTSYEYYESVMDDGDELYKKVRHEALTIAEGRRDSLPVELIGDTRRDVLVDARFFAREPSRFMTRLVRSFPFMRDAPVDQCGWRKLGLIAIGLSIPLQIYGVFARVATLLFGLFMAMRGMRFAALFDLNPHQFASEMDSSFWLHDSDGYERHVWWKYVTPPYLLLFGAILVFDLFVPTGFAATIVAGQNGHNNGINLNEYVNGLIWWHSILAAIALILFTIGWIGSGGPADAFDKLRQMRPVAATSPNVYDSLRARQQAGNEGLTARILYQEFKAKVCKPFAER